LTGVVRTPSALGRESWLRRASYAGRVGERFTVRVAGGQTVTLRLAGVDDLVGTTPSGVSVPGRDDAVLLELRGPKTPRLAQGVHELRHRTLGRSRLFVVPQARSGYAIVINRSARAR
jgi:hypothetical protein